MNELILVFYESGLRERGYGIGGGGGGGGGRRLRGINKGTNEYHPSPLLCFGANCPSFLA